MKNQGQFFTDCYKKINKIYLDQHNNILKTNFEIYVDDVSFDGYRFYKFNNKFYEEYSLREILNGTFG